MSSDGGFIKCDGCGLWIEGEVHITDDDEELCDECFEQEDREEFSEGEDDDEE